MPAGTIPEFDLYAELEVAPHASPETIGAAYRSLARRYHPDAHSTSPISDERMRRLNIAYKWLTDVVSRQVYDDSRANESRPKQGRVRPRARAARSRARTASQPNKRVTPEPVRGSVPRAGVIWFGNSVDLQTLELSGRGEVFGPNRQVALIAHLSRPSRGEVVYFEIDFGRFPATWPGAVIPAGSDIYAAVLPAAEMAMAESEDVTVRVKDLGGNDLAVGDLKVVR